LVAMSVTIQNKQTMNYLGATTIALDSAHIADLSTGAVPYSFPVSAGGRRGHGR
jgi:hypothetical protein